NIAESLKAETKGQNIDIKLINPGFVRTPMTDKNDFTMPMMIEPAAAARAIAKGLLSNRFEIHFPFKFTILLKIARLLPAALYFRIVPR
ncbi:MAG: short-chain dehydrogenase, partial [Alphaproteobacteria bacterium]|nr:short-chain dehydrogenase [Alphaproteobacteria bacterium]